MGALALLSDIAKFRPIFAFLTDDARTRFSTLDTAQPFFCGCDRNPKTSLAVIEYERRNGYSGYVSSPAKLIKEEFPAWRTRHAR